MRLFDSARKSYLEFRPGQTATIYVCGITPYDSAHLGHIFTFMAYDLVQRRLEDLEHEVKLVRNITDVDEPIYAKAAELGIDYRELAARETASFQDVLRQLNFRMPFAEPKASEYIEPMAEAVGRLLEGGFAYRLDEDIFFDVSKVRGFGSFSGFSHRLLTNFLRERGGNPERPGKRQQLDFLLWRGVSDPADPAAWETGLGRGRPGWHIECSVMSSTLLGVPFDLHGGGSDLIFPHHECEIAQSCGLGEERLARRWMHVSPLLFAGEKMSKSLGNLVFAKDLLGTHEPAVIRLALLFYRYRIGGEWQADRLERAAGLLSRLRLAGERLDRVRGEQLLGEVRAALDDDLDSHRILHALHESTLGPAGDGSGREPYDKTMDLLGLLPTAGTS